MVDRLRLVGQTIDDRYHVEALIGEGAIGAVYRAHSTRLAKVVAIKAIHRDFVKDPGATQRWIDDTSTMATLGHPNIVASSDIGALPDGSRYVVLEFLDGRQLSDAIQHSGRLSTRRTLRIARQVVAAVAAAHDCGVLHHDLRSDNVFLVQNDDTADVVKVLDFGIARLYATPGQPLITPEFIAPEQIADPERVDVSTDIYSVGAMMYHMLAGNKPYVTTGPIATLLRKILSEPPAPLPNDIQPEVRDLVARAMARDPAARPPSMRELGDLIDRIPQHSSMPIPVVTQVATTRDTAPTPSVVSPVLAITQPPMGTAHRRRVLPLALAALVTMIAVAIGAVVVMKSGDTERTEVVARDPSPARPPPPPATVDNAAEVTAAAAPADASEPSPSTDGTGAAHTSTARVDEEKLEATRRAEAANNAEAAKREAEKREVMKREAEKREADKREADKREADKREADKREAEKRDADKREADKREAERRDAEKRDADMRAHVEDADAAKRAEAGKRAEADKRAEAAEAEKTKAAKGTVDPAAIRAAVKAKLDPIMACFQRARMDEPSLSGVVNVQITEGADGKVTGAGIASSTLGSPSAEQCIVGEIRQWRLPAPSGGASATFVYPFVLH